MPVLGPAHIPRPTLPAWIVLGMTVGATLANGWAGLRLSPPPVGVLSPMLVTFLIAWWASLRGASRLAEAGFYIGLWVVWSNISVEISYLVALDGATLRDALLARADAAIGFCWDGVARFTSARPLLTFIEASAYSSSPLQIAATVCLLAWLGPPGRNRELFVQVSVALALCLAVFAAAPAYGPGERFGWRVPWDDVLRTLRNGHSGPLPYAGIVEFPSFHTVLALVLTYAHRGNRWCLLVVGALNLAMLSAVPLEGNHYAVDMAGGAVVALTSVGLERWLPGGRCDGRATARVRRRKTLHISNIILPSRRRDRP